MPSDSLSEDVEEFERCDLTRQEAREGCQTICRRPPDAARELAGDGNFGGAYERPDAEVLAMWRIAVEETRALIEGPWG